MLKANWRTILGILMFLAGLIWMFAVLKSAYTMITAKIWKLGILGNVFLSIGTVLLMRGLLEHLHENWSPTGEEFYIEWQRRWKKQQKTMMLIGGFALFLAILFFQYHMRFGWRYSYMYNLAPGYLVIATVILQYGLCQFSLIKYMKEKLEALMECMRTVNQKQLEAAMEIERQSLMREAKSEQLKVELISNVSHDLKTPLTSMVGYIELMKKEELSDVTRDYVAVISEKAEKLKAMIESLFSIAKASSGNVELNPEEIELNMLIEQIFADMNDRIENSGLKFVKSLTAEDTRMTTDNLHMYRICQNLIENALKYSAAGTRVFVKSFVEDDKISMEITNTAGYEMDFDKEDIVDRFARGDKARSSDGNGLGLAIVSTYAGALGGSFDIHIDCDQFKAIVKFPKEMKK